MAAPGTGPLTPASRMTARLTTRRPPVAAAAEEDVASQRTPNQWQQGMSAVHETK